MTPEELRALVHANALEAGLEDARVLIAPDPFEGFRIRVVHPRLASLSDEERRLKLLKGVASLVGTAELLTPEEEQWYGEAFVEHDGGIPTWADMWSQPDPAEALVFASDLDEDIEPPAVVTFYSLRGGVGRTTALAAAARILASRGRRVLCIDMDFEAPGLSVLLGLTEPEKDKGALPLLLALEHGDEVDIRDHVQRVTEAYELYCVPAGRLGVEYAERLRLLDPEVWYRESSNALHMLLDLAKGSSLNPDLILLDSRTGISPISAPLLFDVSDLAVVSFFPHPQAKRGTELLVRALLGARSRRIMEGRSLSPEPRFLVAPVPPGPSGEQVERRAISWIEEWLSSAQKRRIKEVGPLRAEELTHYVLYSPETAFRDRVTDAPSVRDPYVPVADWLEQLLPQAETILGPNRSRKKDALRELDFSTGTAEYQESFAEDFVKTKVSSQAMERRYPLVIGRKGTGKTAVFRWLLERSPEGYEPIPVFCPNAYRDRIRWALSADGFSSVERNLGNGAGWRTFWACYTALAVYLAMPVAERVAPPDRFALDLSELANAYDELAVLDALTSMLEQPEAGLLASRWLRHIDAATHSDRFLLFDGLDTGFGNDTESRSRRTRAVTGLMSFLTETEAQLARLSFKVMLRFDIWQQLRFENKSHLFGRSVQLTWRDQGEYFKTALKQALRSPVFRRMVVDVHVPPDVGSWGADEVFRAWNILVGERMKGGKTTFTRNWVWNRLADGQGDHGPRALSQLFHEAVQWEQREEERSGYDRSIIRPRALVPSLDRVSEEALQALGEEFSELQNLIEVLQALRRTPLDPTDIEQADPKAAEHLELALEVGLLAVYEGTQDDVRRYRVPDLYRLALGMTRKGQA